MKILKEYLIAILAIPLVTIIFAFFPVTEYTHDLLCGAWMVVVFAYVIYGVIVNNKTNRKIRDRYGLFRNMYSIRGLEAFMMRQHDEELLEECKRVHHLIRCFIIMIITIPATAAVMMIPT